MTGAPGFLSGGVVDEAAEGPSRRGLPVPCRSEVAGVRRRTAACRSGHRAEACAGRLAAAPWPCSSPRAILV